LHLHEHFQIDFQHFKCIKIKHSTAATVIIAFIATAQQRLNQMRLQAIATAGNYLTAQELD